MQSDLIAKKAQKQGEKTEGPENRGVVRESSDGLSRLLNSHPQVRELSRMGAALNQPSPMALRAPGIIQGKFIGDLDGKSIAEVQGFMKSTRGVDISVVKLSGFSSSAEGYDSAKLHDATQASPVSAEGSSLSRSMPSSSLSPMSSSSPGLRPRIEAPSVKESSEGNSNERKSGEPIHSSISSAAAMDHDAADDQLDAAFGKLSQLVAVIREKVPPGDAAFKTGFLDVCRTWLAHEFPGVQPETILGNQRFAWGLLNAVQASGGFKSPLQNVETKISAVQQGLITRSTVFNARWTIRHYTRVSSISHVRSTLSLGLENPDFIENTNVKDFSKIGNVGFTFYLLAIDGIVGKRAFLGTSTAFAEFTFEDTSFAGNPEFFASADELPDATQPPGFKGTANRVKFALCHALSGHVNSIRGFVDALDAGYPNFEIKMPGQPSTANALTPLTQPSAAAAGSSPQSGTGEK